MASQIVGYRYFTNFLLFIGNPIEKMLAINFDKRGWISGDRASDGDNGELIGIKAQNLYGENEGGVYGVINLHTGTNAQLPDAKYSQYMSSKGLQASAYPYQSYLSFSGSGKANTGNSLIDGVFGVLAGYMNDAFYVGNSGYMKEMLLWVKRTRVRNDGRRQWYELRGDGAVVCEIGSYKMIQYPGNVSVGQKSINIKKSYQNQIVVNPYPDEYTTANVVFTGTTDSDLYSEFNDNNTTMDGVWDREDEGKTIKATYMREIFANEINGILKISAHVIVYGENFSIVPIGDSISSKQEFIGYYKEHFFTDARIYLIEYVFILPQSVVGFKSTASAINPQIGQSVFTGDRKFSIYDILSEFEKYEIESPDINPIHKIREILTDDTAMNKPESSVNDLNLMKAADRIFDEGLGISWSITEKSCIDAINELCYHIEAGIRVNRQTGLYEVILFRDNWFDEDEIHTISESKIKSMQYEITNADEVINQVNVNFYDRANIKNSSFSISESGLIQTLGRVNAETVDFPYFMNMRNAEIVANWKLKILSTGVLKGSFTTGWREARKWNRYDLIRLPWSRRWIGTILVRIMGINLGGPTNNEVSIEFVEVVPSTGMMNTTIVADDVIDKPLPPQVCQYEPFELPYYLAVMALGQRKADEELVYESNFGLAGVVAEQPQSNSLYAVMMTNKGDEWVRAGSIQYSQTVDLDQIISKVSSSFTVKNWKKISNISAGTLIKCGRDWLGTPGEWMVFQGVDPSTGIVSVKRGALDTPPQEWGLGTKLYFCGNDISYDQTEYVSGEDVLVSALTTTPSGVLKQDGSISVEMKARAIRPYPPANVKFNDVYFPETLIVTNNIVLNWAHRNRAQQTGGDILGWYDGDVTVEDGVTYAYELISENVVLDSQSNITANTATIHASALKPNRPHTLCLWSVRDGYDSYQTFEHSFFVESASLILTATIDGSNVTGNTVPTANISVNVDESLSANMQFDGSSISGKAIAGSTITIEIQE